MIQMNLHAALGAGTFPTNQIGSLPLGQSQRVAAKPRATTARNTFYNDDAGLVEACLAGDDAAGRNWSGATHRRLFHPPAIRPADNRRRRCAADRFHHRVPAANSLKNQRCLAAWLITITRRECLHHCKRTPENAELIDEITDGGNYLADRVEEQQRRLIVHQALGRLDPKSQVLLSALFLELPTPSYEAIAQRLGMAVGSIGPARARCLKKVEAVLLDMDSETFRP